MIVWSGRGFLVVIIFTISMFFSISILPVERGNYSFVIAMYITAIFSRYFGVKWNRLSERIVTDEKTGQKLKIKNNHTLFWIPMQHWGLVAAILGTNILLQNSVILGGIALGLLLLIIVFTFIKRGNNQRKPIKSSTHRKRKIRKEEIEVKVNNASSSISEFKKEQGIKKEFEPSDHNRFRPK